MTDFRITEADVGKKFRLRNGDVVTVTKVHSRVAYPVEIACGDTYLSDGRFWSDTEPYPLDIVEKLPEEGSAETIEGALDTPTMTASDGKQYPMELFGVQQRFSDRTPPEGVDLVIYEGGDLSESNYQYRDGRLAFFKRGELVNCLGDESDMTWALKFPAPSPAVEKVEPQIWDDYFHDVDIFDLVRPDDGMQLAILPRDLPDMSDAIDALHAWKNHVLAKANPNE